MKRTLLLALALTLASVAAFAADSTFTGILMDKSCRVDMKEDAKGHDKACNLMPDCVKSGYGLVTADGKFLAFDPKGNKDASAWLKATKKTKDLQGINDRWQIDTLNLEGRRRVVSGRSTVPPQWTARGA